MNVSPLAGKPAPSETLLDVSQLVAAYYHDSPDPSVSSQRVAFGTSGHRGSAFERSFNEAHIVAITKAICEYRTRHHVDGPLFLGIDTHALSKPAADTALQVLAAHAVDVMLAAGDDYTPTPAVSHAILTWNRGRESGIADGIVVTPSHNPPESGGFKYNLPNGGPAGTDVTGWIEHRANEILRVGIESVKRVSSASALAAPTTHRHDYRDAYVRDLGDVIDMKVIRDSGIRMGVDPMGGAGVHYWSRIAELYQLDLEVVNDAVDATFSFMPLDWDGRIRMDPSSPHAMQNLIGLKDRFDIAFACDTDHDRHGIVAPSTGLLPSNDYLAVAIDYLFRHREGWNAVAAVGKTIVSSQLIDRVAKRLGRALHEVPAGFKWFVDDLYAGALGFAGEESAGASFLRRSGEVWTTDKDGLTPALLSAEITSRTGRDPGELYRELAEGLGIPFYDRIEAPATPDQKMRLSSLSAHQVESSELAGETITSVLTRAPGNGAAIGGLKVTTQSGWFAARPSGTENLYKIYAESFRDEGHLRRIANEAQAIVDRALAA